jgi:hypothetical protein
MQVAQEECSLCSAACHSPVLCDACKAEVSGIVDALEVLQGMPSRTLRKVWRCANCKSERFAADYVPPVVLACVDCGYKKIELVEL